MVLYRVVNVNMPRRWTKDEEDQHRTELIQLYVEENLTIKEVAQLLHLSEKTIFQRLQRLGVKSTPYKKNRYLNKRSDISIPQAYSPELAEMFGILLGDGHVTHFQLQVTLGDKELSYAKYVQRLVKFLFNGRPKISIRKQGYRTVYLGSTEVTQYLFNEGLVKNKVAAQVGVPAWIQKEPKFYGYFIRGFFDTDGSVYALKFGTQISFTNYSLPILEALHFMLQSLEYSPSKISHHKIYLTKRDDVDRFFMEIQPKNIKHVKRYRSIKSVGTQAVNEGGL